MNTKSNDLSNFHVLLKSDNPEFQQREHGIAHTTYLEEIAFYSLIQNGDVEKVEQAISHSLKSGIVVGRLSDDPLRQMQYWAVCFVTLGTRYAIQGGLDEMTAYNLSDSYIMQVDKLTDQNSIAELIQKLVLELATLVKENSYKDCPTPVRKALTHINRHLHEQILLADLAKLTSLSEDYISKLFKKYVGKTVREYILFKRLESAKSMLKSGCDEQTLGYFLGFCSQTYFISCFKAAYGITPHKYARMCHGM